MTAWKNIKIKQSVGKFYESSKTEIEGWEKVDTKEHGNRWHRVFSTITGTITKIMIDESGSFGDRLKIFVDTGEDEVSVLEMPLFNINKSLYDYARSLAMIIDGVKLGGENTHEIFLNSKNKDKNDFLYKNIFIKQNGETVKPSVNKADVPAWEEKPDPVKKGKKVWDSTANTKYLYDILYDFCEGVTPSASSENTPPVTNTEKAISKPVEKKVVEDVVDNLPF